MAASATLSTSLTTVRPKGRATATATHTQGRLDNFQGPVLKSNMRFKAGLAPTKVVCLHNNVVSVLSPQLSADQRFRNNFISMKAAAPGINKKRGFVFSTRSAASEIFNIATIMTGITLAGVAIGFVLLQIESFVKESAL